jgi:hypothetical protein
MLRKGRGPSLETVRHGVALGAGADPLWRDRPCTGRVWSSAEVESDQESDHNSARDDERSRPDSLGRRDSQTFANDSLGAGIRHHLLGCVL